MSRMKDAAIDLHNNMTKVEELTERIEKFATSEKGHDWLHSMLATLISVATEEGSDDGWAATKMIWERMQEWNKEWQKENPKERKLTLLDAMDLIEWKVAKGRAEGAEEERARIRTMSRDLNRVYELPGPCVLVQTAVLAPKEKP